MEQLRINKFLELCKWIENQVPFAGFKMNVEIVKMPNFEQNGDGLQTNISSETSTGTATSSSVSNNKSAQTKTDTKPKRVKKRPDTFMVKIILNTRRVKNSNRHQWLLIEYDSVYYPERYYHFSIHFIVCSGKSVDDFIKSM